MTASPEWVTQPASLTSAGVRVAIRPDAPGVVYLHAKAIVADGTTAFVGSQNFSTSSLDFDRELGVITTDPAVVGPLSKTLVTDVAGAAT